MCNREGATTTPTDTEPTTGLPCQPDPRWDDAAAVMRALGLTDQQICDGMVHVTDTGNVVNSDGQSDIPQPTDEAGLFAFAAAWLTLDFGDADPLFNEPGARFGCGAGPDDLSLCASPEIAPPGSYYVCSAVYEQDIPWSSSVYRQYGFVADRNGQAYDDYIPAPEWPYDFFSNTDTWFVLFYDPSYDAWAMGHYTWSPPLGLFPGAAYPSYYSGARAIVRGNAIVYLVPLGEMAMGRPYTRLTSYWVDPDTYAWSGDVEPPVGEPLYAFPPYPDATSTSTTTP